MSFIDYVILDEEVDEVSCPNCEQLQLGDDAKLGTLGQLGHYRCVFCGWQWAIDEEGATS